MTRTGNTVAVIGLGVIGVPMAVNLSTIRPDSGF